MRKSSGKKLTYTTETTIPHYNLRSLDESDIVNQLEYLLFVEHEEDMKGYTHLLPLLEEIAKLTVRTADKAVEEFQQEITFNIATHLQEKMQTEIANVVFDARIKTTGRATVTTIVDDKGILDQKVEPHHDWE